MATDKIKVAVRVRPFSKREIVLQTPCVIKMTSNQTMLYPPPVMSSMSSDNIKERKEPKTFAFDHCFNSINVKGDYAGQEKVFQCLGRDILDNAFQGYNACIFAYGQTGSGKSYTMMGSHDNVEAGIIPRLADALFDRIAADKNNMACQAKVEVSYMEIYNEKVHDLLDPMMSSSSSNKHGLKVREHNVLGPYVDGLSQLAVISYQEIDDLMVEGNKNRTVAATNMNNESSRSHAVFTVILTQTLTDLESGVSGEKVSKISLVDLAGSERAVKTGACGERLKEGSNINKSLTTLGLVISKLADQTSGKTKDKFVPYRDSTLTWLLKDNLGGNSKTVMVATVSPAADNYEETLSTLRYADRAKRIINHAVVNEDPNARIIRELRAEVDALKEMLKNATQPDMLKEKLCENEKLMKEMSLTWEEKLFKTGQTQGDRRQALEKLGISIQSSGIKNLEKNKYFLVNLNSDPSLNEMLVYYLKSPHTLVGRTGSSENPDIQLSGVGIQNEHCIIEIHESNSNHPVDLTSSESCTLTITPLNDARTCVNGIEIKERTLLQNGDRILWGSNHFFRVNCPKGNSSNSDPTTPAIQFDWKMAQEEVMKADLNNDPIQAAIARLERQYEEDKQTALEKQRQEYEKQVQQLKIAMTPSTPYHPFDSNMRVGNHMGNLNGMSNGNVAGTIGSYGNTPSANGYGHKTIPSTPSVMSGLEKWGQDRDDTFKRSLATLREDIMRANVLVREANFFADEMGRNTKFSVTLQIPPQNLGPNRKRGTFASEPAILVKRKSDANQVWSIEKLELKLIDMRELYEDLKVERGLIKPEEFEAEIGHNYPDPFYESTENHHLIGVANIFLSALFHDVVLDYHVPIISQQGEVAGRLQVQIERVSGEFPESGMNLNTSNQNSSNMDTTAEDCGFAEENTSNMVVRVTIKNAAGLPPSLSHFVFCQYMFWGDTDLTVVPPSIQQPISSSGKNNRNHLSSISSSNQNNNHSSLRHSVSSYDHSFNNPYANLYSSTNSYHQNDNSPIREEGQFHDFNGTNEDENYSDDDPALLMVGGNRNDGSAIFTFDHVQEFNVSINEEFLEHCLEGALSIEVYGHRSAGFATTTKWDERRQLAKSLADRYSCVHPDLCWQCFDVGMMCNHSLTRWSELTRKLEFHVEVQELNDTGEYVPVEVQPRTNVGTGGIFQLRQGQQRRIAAIVKPVSNSGMLPIICESIQSISVGGPCVRSELQKPLDSYQEDDLNRLRQRWGDALAKRKEYLDGQITKYLNMSDKTEAEIEREQSLVEQSFCLVEERKFVMVPDAGSGVPGAPADWDHPDGIEQHVPVLFLDLNADDLSTGYAESGEVPIYGQNSILPKEHAQKFFNLPIVRFVRKQLQCGAIATWDSSIHDSTCLNTVTSDKERAYLIVKAVVRLSDPAAMDLVLRKRIAFNIYKRHSITDKIRRKMGHTSSLTSLGVFYEVVSNIPKASEELEDRESLAVIAAQEGQDSNETVGPDGETFMEKYTRGVSAVETILTLDRLRQSVAVKELLNAKGKLNLSNGGGSNGVNDKQKSLFMRKTVSVPNMSHIMSSSMSFNNLSSFTSMKTSESFSDLNAEMNPNQPNPSDAAGNSASQGASNVSPSESGMRTTRSSLGGLGSISNRGEDGMNNKPFGLETVHESAEADCVARPTSLNLNFSLNSRVSSQQQQHQGGATGSCNSMNKSTPSPGGSGLKKHQQPTPRGSCMTTVQEELEQSTEDIAKATEESMQCKPDMNSISIKTSTASQKEQSINTAKERLVNEKDTPVMNSSKECTQNQSKPHTGMKGSSNGGYPLTMGSTVVGHSTASLQASRISSVQSSSILCQNPSSSSPTVQAITTTQVVSGTIAAHESGQNSCGQNEIATSNNSHQCVPTNTNAVPGVSIPANEQVMAIKHGQLRIDANSKLSNSHTLDSLNELQVSKTGTPSMISSGYGSQAVSSNTLSSEDSMSLRSISVDDTPDTEVPSSSTVPFNKQNSVDNYHPSEATSSKNITAQALKMVQPTTALKPSSMSYSPNDLLSPPDVSLTSISPGEETDATVTVEESTPSSANITPSISGDQLIDLSESSSMSIGSKISLTTGSFRTKSIDLASNGDGKLSINQDADYVQGTKGKQNSQTKRSCIAKSSTSSKNSVTAATSNSGGKIKLRERRSNGTIKASQNPNRASYPSALLPTVTENRSFDNKGQYNTQTHQRTQSFNKQDSDTNLSIGLDSRNGVVSGVSTVTTSRNNSNERLSGTDDESEMRSPASVDSSTSCTSSNNAASTNELATNLPEWMIEGERILLRKSNLSGTIAYIGPIEFASGTWIGIELDVPVGKNDGSVKGVRYFTCPPKRGKFVRPNNVLLDKRRKGSGSLMTRSLTGSMMRTSTSMNSSLYSMTMSSMTSPSSDDLLSCSGNSTPSTPSASMVAMKRSTSKGKLSATNLKGFSKQRK